ncbi:hypothetical protein N869_05445 [Cellulomonas bogoriensis 69B4 = DSM 16987]|uniref:Uncharacterized protein n=1 Tax=Cellulomonas bogoriensis 69B4 = DSM 16987 TaxID=1386082 RepID=A0A0A0C241_9CELL|nr:hypothetical protein N869_05445 [Cellulomonas bogoriensis 69B4 = DSM 16987]
MEFQQPSSDQDAEPADGGAAAVTQAALQAWRRTALLASGVAVAAVVGLVAVLVTGRDQEDLAGPPPSGPEGAGAAEEPAVPTETPDAPEPVPAVAEEALTWAPPPLEDPETIEVDAGRASLDLDPDRDYVIELPPEPLDVPGGVVLNGGRNVVMIGGEIHISRPGQTGPDVRGLYLKDQTGVVHVEGVLFSGPELAEGINLDQRQGAVVQLQNLRFETVRAGPPEHHADIIQTWAGPRELRVDGLSGSTEYQGFFLLPKEFGDQPEPDAFHLRRVDITGTPDAGYLLWRDERGWPMTIEDVWVDRAQQDTRRGSVLWRDDQPENWWDGVEVGAPPDGPFVPDGVAGVDYVSPGYVSGD